VKTLVLFLIAIAAKMERLSAFALGLLLSQGGEFGFVLFGQAKSALLIAPEASSLFSAVVTLSMATTPFLMSLARRLGGEAAGAKLRGLTGPEEAAPANAIVIGYGRFGQTVTQMLYARGLSLTIIDIDAEMIEVAGRMDMKVYYGDGTRVDLLRHAGADEAKLICLCMDGEGPDAEVIGEIRNAFPQAALFVRLFDRRHALALQSLEITGVVREVYESAICMGRQILESLQAEAEEVDRIEADYRERDQRRLQQQHDSDDIRTGLGLLYRPGRPAESLDAMIDGGKA
jgi:glutathione-regulated potassium-efflux system protein KefB